MKRLRCAVYTRKSTEDGLEQEFNSLDAQREACEAYVLSQRHEGWSLIPNRYDDGGFSGGNMERPGLIALLADVGAGLVDVIVVYKVDRLTRSLADFAKIVEQLDAQGASFVSVTQAFNTTTSMGRLTLNVLLSFAQFEREVTGERIRDKIAASKRKGLWMGGPVPLGYQVIDRKLVAVPEEAERVRTIMHRYIESSSANALIAQLQAEGIVTKVQHRASGPHRGGIPFRRGSLFHLLKNPVYRGMIVHKGNAYLGEHEAIVGEDLWNAVQRCLAAKAPPRRRMNNEPQRALLRGLLNDPEGRPMVPTYGSKGPRRYAYYETRKDLARPDAPASTRLRRAVLETHLIEHLTAFLRDEHALRRLTGIDEADSLRTLFETAHRLAGNLSARAGRDDALRGVIGAMQIGKDHIDVQLQPCALGLATDGRITWRIPIPAKRPFRETRLRIDLPGGRAQPNLQLIGLLADAFEVQKLIMDAPGLSMNQLAKREGRCRTQLTRLLRICWLSPKIVERIAAGAQPASLTRKSLLTLDVPVDWNDQERLFGLAG